MPRARPCHDDGFLRFHQYRGQDLGTTSGALPSNIEAKLLDVVELRGMALQHYFMKTQTDTYTSVWTWSPGGPARTCI